MDLDSRMKQLLRELGRAINEAVSDSERIAESIARIKANGYDVFLMLDAVVGLNKRATTPLASESSTLTTQDRRFLKSLKIRIDAETPETESAPDTPLSLTPQDAKFLKSLRISIDDVR